MATRRCITKEKYTQKRFLEMNPQVRDIYTYLVLFSDIDGVVEAYSVMRMLQAPFESIQILAESGYVTILNDEMVTYINDFTSFNILDGRDAKGSKYRELLCNIIPDVKLTELTKRKRTINYHGNTMMNSNQPNKTKQNNPAFCHFRKNDYDFDELEDNLLNRK